MKSKIDFIKVFDEGRLICVVNLNYMFPIPRNEVNVLRYKDIGSYRSFNSDEEKGNYIQLLRSEMTQIRKLNIEQKAKRVYDLVTKNIDAKLIARCFDYKGLETACSQYYNYSGE